MAGIENLHSGLPSSARDPKREEEREYYFRAIVQSKLLDAIRASLDEADFTPEETSALASAVAELSDEEQRQVLALPYELRGKLFAKYHQAIEAGTLTPAQMVQDILEKNKRYGFTLGYHLSTHAIPQKGEHWDIEGTELDDRDDRPMAYYSEDYLHRYQKKNGRYLYVVRAETRPEGSHKRDLANRWGRAPFLSIISEFDMQEVEREIDEMSEKEKAAP